MMPEPCYYCGRAIEKVGPGACNKHMRQVTEEYQALRGQYGEFIEGIRHSGRFTHMVELSTKLSKRC